jgi:GNAT superfamily N-acetyltransferase
VKRIAFAAWRFLAGLVRPSRKRNARRLRECGEDVDSLVIRPATAWFCFVVENRRGELIGFAQGNRSDHPEYAGELNKIYLLREYQGVGLGRRLIGVVAHRFLSEGVDSMWLFGDARNPSNKVWLALGAVKTDDDPGVGNYGWRDLRPLINRRSGAGS